MSVIVHDSIEVSTDNVMSLPMNPNIKKTLESNVPATIIALQEIDPVKFKDAAEALPGYDLVPIPEERTYSTGILYKTDEWELVHHYYVKEYDGVAHISLTRHMCVARLKNKRHGYEIVAMSYHAVTNGEDKTRIRLRRRGNKMRRKQIRKFKKKGLPILLMGDFNRMRVMHPLASIKLRNRIDHIYFFNSSKVKAKKKRTKTINTPSDHNTFIATLGVDVSV